MKILLSFTHPHAVPNLFDFLSSKDILTLSFEST